MSNEKGARTYTSKTLQRVLQQVSPKEQKKTTQRMLLAAKIADAIVAKGWTNKELAVRLDKHPSEVTRWVSGTHNFTSDILFDIQDELGIHLISLDPPAIKPTVVEINVTLQVVIPVSTYPLHFARPVPVTQKRASWDLISTANVLAYAG